MKKTPLKNAHASNSKIGSGDYYGSGLKNKMAKPRSIMGVKPLKKDSKRPPRSLA